MVMRCSSGLYRLDQIMGSGLDGQVFKDGAVELIDFFNVQLEKHFDKLDCVASSTFCIVRHSSETRGIGKPSSN